MSLSSRPWDDFVVRVLVVEDDTDSRELIATVLTQAGAVTFTASNGRDGIAMAPRVHPDVLVCDLAMPQMDGFQLIGALRGRLRPDRPLLAIAVSAHTLPDDRDRALAAGFDRHVPKPVDLEELINAIRLMRV